MSEEFKRVHKEAHKNLVEVDCVPLTPLFINRFTRINFFSLDVEGYELNFLESIDFESVKIDTIITETSSNITKNLLLIDFLINKGFTCYGSLVPRSYLFIHRSVGYCYRLLKTKTLDNLLHNF